VRRAHASDRRARVVHLTLAGRSLIAAAFAGHSRAMEKAASGLTAPERVQLIALLKKLGMEADHLVASSPLVSGHGFSRAGRSTIRERL
jgi:MarR family transcriptional regulator, 2-MHQ and catechol-resistance regulon repressor